MTLLGQPWREAGRNITDSQEHLGGSQRPNAHTAATPPAGTPSIQRGRETDSAAHIRLAPSLPIVYRAGREAGPPCALCPAQKMHRENQKPGAWPTRNLGVKLHAGRDRSRSYTHARPNREGPETVNKPHSPEDIALPNSSTQNGV